MATREDWAMLNQSLQNLGETFGRRRAEREATRRFDANLALEQARLDQQRAEHELDRKLRQDLLKEQVEAGRWQRAQKSGTSFRWKSRGTEMTADSPERYQELLAQYPVDTEDGKQSVTVSGTNEHGVTTTQTITGTPAALAKMRDAIKPPADAVAKGTRPPADTAAARNAAKLGELQDAVAAAEKAGDADALARAKRALANFEAMTSGAWQTETTIFPPVEGKPGIPATPGTSGLFGRTPGTPEIPAIPATPGTNVTRRVRVPLTPPPASSTAPPPASSTAPPLTNAVPTGTNAVPMVPFQQSQDPDDSPEAVMRASQGTGNPAADALIEEAEKALERGANRDAVMARLNELLKPYGLRLK